MSTKTTGNRVAIYARISQDHTGEALGVDRQEAKLRKIIAAEGLTVVGVYTDNDISAWSGKPRPELARLLADIEAGRVDHVAALAVDRLIRRLEERLALLRAVQGCGGLIYTALEGTYNPSSAEGKLRVNLMADLAEFESNRKSERIREKTEELAKAGKNHGGTRPYGWQAADRNLLEPAEAQVVRDMAQRFLAGEGLATIARDLNSRGILTAKGKQWQQATVRQTLANPRLAGHRVHKGELVAIGTWEPILTDDTWRRVQAKLADPARRKTRPGGRRHLLAGLVHCGAKGCGAPLVARPMTNGRVRYVCVRDPLLGRRSGCGKLAVMGDAVDRVVQRALLEEAEEANLSERIAATITKPADGSGVEAKLVELEDMWESGELDRAGFLRMRGKLQAQLEEVQAQEAEALRLRQAAVNVEDLRQDWPHMTLAEKQSAMASLIERVTIAPVGKDGPKDPAARVQVEWAA